MEKVLKILKTQFYLDCFAIQSNPNELAGSLLKMRPGAVSALYGIQWRMDFLNVLFPFVGGIDSHRKLYMYFRYWLMEGISRLLTSILMVLLTSASTTCAGVKKEYRAIFYFNQWSACREAMGSGRFRRRLVQVSIHSRFSKAPSCIHTFLPSVWCALPGWCGGSWEAVKGHLASRSLILLFLGFCPIYSGLEKQDRTRYEHKPGVSYSFHNLTCLCTEHSV